MVPTSTLPSYRAPSTAVKEIRENEILPLFSMNELCMRNFPNGLYPAILFDCFHPKTELTKKKNLKRFICS